MIRGPLAVRTCERSSSKAMSRIQCRRSSIPQWPRMMAASWAWVAWMARSEVTAQQVSAGHFPFTLRRRTIWMAWQAWAKARPLATAVTLRVRRSVRTSPAVTALSGLVSDRDVPPGQGGKLGIQAGLISLDRDQIVRAAPGEVAGVLTLGVQSVRGDDRVLDVQAVAQRGEHRDFVCLGAHLHLAQHHAMGLVERREQVTATVTIVRGAT
jgi:hypothetical protein